MWELGIHNKHHLVWFKLFSVLFPLLSLLQARQIVPRKSRPEVVDEDLAWAPSTIMLLSVTGVIHSLGK